MKNISLVFFCFISVGFGQVFQTVSRTNFCKYISTDSSENRTVSIDTRTPEKAILIDFDTGDTTAYDISWMLKDNFTGDLGGSNLFIFTKGIVAGDSDIYLIYAHQGSGYVTWMQSHGYYANLYIINFRTRQKILESELNNYYGFKFGELRFSKTGTYLVAIAETPYFPFGDNTVFFKLNSLDLTNVIPDKKKNISLFGP